MNEFALARPAPQSRGLIAACLAATWLIWGSTYLAIRYALLGFPPFLQMGTRFLVAGALLMAWSRWRGAPWPTPIQWRNALAVGALLLAGGMGCTAYAEQTVGSGLVVAFIAIVPMMIALVNLGFGLRPARLEVWGIAVGVVGVLLLTRGDGFRASPSGLVALVVACSSWSLGSVLSQQMLRLAPGPAGYASEMLCGGAVLMALAAIRGEQFASPLPSEALAAWGYLVVFGTLVAFNAYMVLLDRASAALASSYTFVNPLIAMLLGIAVAGEQVSPYEWAAVGVVLAGVVLLLFARRR